MIPVYLDQAESMEAALDALFLAFGMAAQPDSVEPANQLRLRGRGVVCDALGISANTVGWWLKRGRIPPEYWHELAKLAADSFMEGVTCESLSWLHSRRRWPSDRPNP